MSYARTFAFSLGTSNAGLSDLRAQLYDSDGSANGSAVSTGFTDRGRGLYRWYYAGFPVGFRGWAEVYSAADSDTVLALAEVNAEDVAVAGGAAMTARVLARNWPTGASLYATVYGPDGDELVARTAMTESPAGSGCYFLAVDNWGVSWSGRVVFDDGTYYRTEAFGPAQSGDAYGLLAPLISGGKFTATALEDAPAGGGGGGGTDWDATERAQIRYRLGLDGTQTAPAATTGTLPAIQAKTGLLGTGEPAVVLSPVGNGGSVTLYKGTDYTTALGNPLDIPDASPSALPAITTAVTFQARSRRRPDSHFNVTGTVIDAGGGTKKARFDIPRTAYTSLPVSDDYEYFIYHGDRRLDITASLALRQGVADTA